MRLLCDEMDMVETKLEILAERMIGKELRHIWNGYGSSLFLEFGNLLDAGKRQDGSPRNPEGEIGVMIEWSWRIEGKKRIITGSWSDTVDWERGFKAIKGQKVSEVSTFGKFPEIHIAFENGASCTSFMTAQGHPEWALFDRRLENDVTLHSRNCLIEEQ